MQLCYFSLIGNQILSIRLIWIWVSLIFFDIVSLVEAQCCIYEILFIPLFVVLYMIQPKQKFHGIESFYRFGKWNVTYFWRWKTWWFHVAFFWARLVSNSWATLKFQMFYVLHSFWKQNVKIFGSSIKLVLFYAELSAVCNPFAISQNIFRPNIHFIST